MKSGASERLFSRASPRIERHWRPDDQATKESLRLFQSAKKENLLDERRYFASFAEENADLGDF